VTASGPIRKAAVIGAAWVLVVVTLYFVGTVLYEWDALDRQPDGWCELLPFGAPSEDDPDCDNWDSGSGIPPAS
jgi:hypothetical protein